MADDAFKNYFPDTAVLLTLDPDDFAISLLSFLKTLPVPEFQLLRPATLNYVYISQVYPHPESAQIELAVRDAWVVLVREGLLAQVPDNPGSYFITKRGASIKSSHDVEMYRKAALLPKSLLHPDLAAYVLSDFNRGDYEAAVFKAFKHIEVRVRKAAMLSDNDVGTKLMRKAFSIGCPLADKTVVEGEQQAIADIFAGSMGAFKNPTSHRYVSFSDPGDAVALILFANYLLNIVEDRIATINAAGGNP